MADEKDPIWFRYTFVLDDGRKRVFEVKLDPDTLSIIRNPGMQSPPEWTTLGYSPCAHCPLPPESKHCPIALNFSDVVEAFNDVVSCRSAEVTVESRERKYSKSCSVQEALFPLLGIYMSASGCPSMEPFKPLVRFHLPFSSVEETIYRVISMYVTAQYMRMQSGLRPDWDLKGITDIYAQVNQVNREFCQRLTKAVKEDAVVNAVVILSLDFYYNCKVPLINYQGQLSKVNGNSFPLIRLQVKLITFLLQVIPVINALNCDGYCHSIKVYVLIVCESVFNINLKLEG